MKLKESMPIMEVIYYKLFLERKADVQEDKLPLEKKVYMRRRTIIAIRILNGNEKSYLETPSLRIEENIKS